MWINSWPGFGKFILFTGSVRSGSTCTHFFVCTNIISWSGPGPHGQYFLMVRFGSAWSISFGGPVRVRMVIISSRGKISQRIRCKYGVTLASWRGAPLAWLIFLRDELKGYIKTRGNECFLIAFSWTEITRRQYWPKFVLLITKPKDICRCYIVTIYYISACRLLN